MGTEGNNSSSGCGNIEVSSWLKGLAVAPEYHPTLAEFQDPIGYIFKIEKEASRYGICKIVPPVPAAGKKTAISNLNRSLLARSRLGCNGGSPTFTSRQQQIGFCPRKHQRPVQKPVWQSGETYTVQEFEAKAKGFEKGYLKKFGKKPLNALEIETLYWKATLDKPFSVEYANDMPGSAFSLRGGDGKSNNTLNNCNVTVGETEWNMRGVSRAKGSLLRFMKEEIPGVTSPMVYIAMMFSWFAWHVEDHDLHSLNYLHMGAGKTWYGVPREAAVAFEDVIRVHGYGGEMNPLVTFATLGEKTTVMSPEVLINAGVPCCRLVQNPGEFVVTFPGAYHSGFSHGFNCGEAANIATPEWLTVAKDAAIRRASINLPPMVSHFQLLYDLALSLCSRVAKKDCTEPRSSRLKDKKKDEGEILVKDQFVQDVLQNNGVLHFLCKGSSVVVLPRISLSKSICSNQEGNFQSKVKAGLFGSLCSPDLEVKTRKSFVSDCSVLDSNQGSKNATGVYSMNWKYSPICDAHNLSFSGRSDHVASPLGSQTMRIDPGSDKDQCDRVTRQGLFSCTTCGILCFASVAVVQPTETASQYLMSGDCSIFSDWGATADCSAALNDDASPPRLNFSTGLMLKRTTDGLFDVPIKASSLMQPPDDENEVPSSTEARKQTSSLGLLALNYGDSDSDDDEADIPVESCETNSKSSLPQSGYGCDNTEPAHHCESSYNDPSYPFYDSADGIPLKIDSYELTKAKFKGKDEGTPDHKPKTGLQHFASISSLGGHKTETVTSSALVLSESTNKPFAPRSDEDSSRMHLFCLQHAVQVEQQLRSIGGAHVVLLCHPDYPALEAQAKKLAEELGNDKLWSDISFRGASKEDEKMIQLALDSEEAIHGNGDWAVKLGINLCYSANLSRSPLYSKQLPYNRLIYNAFGCRSIVNDVNDAQANGKWSGRHRRIVVAGKWCGKVWMSNQVHHLLAERESEGHDPERNVSGPVKADLKLRTSEAAPTTCKVGRKRKTSAEARSFLKAESLGAEDPEEDFEVLPVSVKLHKDSLRNKRMRKGTPEPQMKSVRNGKQVESEEDSEEDFEVMSISGEQHNEDSEEDSEVLPVSFKQHKDNLRNKRMKKETPEPQMKSVRNGKHVEAEDSEEDFEVMLISGKQQKEDSEEEDFEILPVSGKQHRDNVRSKRPKKETLGPQMKSVRNGKQLQEDLEEDFEVHLPVSDKQHKNNMRNKRMNREHQMKSVRHGKQLEEDSEEDFEVLPVSGKQHRNNLRIRRTKKRIPESQMKSVRNCKQLEEESEEDLEVMPVPGQQLRNNLRNKRTKRGTLETQMSSVRNSKQLEEDSEEDFEALSGQQLKNNLRNKRMKKETPEPQMKIVRHSKQLEEDSEEDSEVLPVSGKQHKNNLRNKLMKKETPELQMKSLRNRKQHDSNSEDEMEGGPSTRLRKRTGKPSKELVIKVEVKPGPRKPNKSSKAKKGPAVRAAVRSNRTKTREEAEFKCDLEGCSMSFGSKQELILHKKNICPVKGCGKKFFSHKYLIQHRRVHLDDRPLKCPWKGCKMTFKWAWARTEHIRVHTGARPYVCAETGCGQTFRFVSDFSRHKRKTGHISKKVKK